MPSSLFNNDIQTTSNGYKVILSYESYNDATHESTTKYAEIDCQDGGVDTKSNVELTSFPTSRGHNISDHIYRQPVEQTIKGVFAENGLKTKNWVGTDRLTQIQTEFEECQRAGVKFNIITMKGNDANNKTNLRFKVRRNMVLTGISWTQMQDSLSFVFNFKEAISSNLEIVPVRMNEIDPNLPAITDLSAASLVGEIIETEDVIQMTIEVLKNLNLVNDATFNRCMATGVAAVAAGISGAMLTILTSAVVAKIAIAIGAATSNIPVVGWIVSAACVIVAGICAIFSWVEAAKRAEQLEHYRRLGHVFLIEDDMTDVEKDEVVRNFILFLAKVKQTVDDTLRDIALYRIAKADRQENMITVNGNYYINQIEKNTDDLSYSIKTFYLGERLVASQPKITALNSFADCTESAASIYFRDSEVTGAFSTYRVYIVNRVGYKQQLLNEESTSTKLLNMQTDQDKYEAEKEALLEFAFVVSPYALDTLTDKVGEAIKIAVG